MNQAFDWRGLARGTFQGSKAVVEKKEGQRLYNTKEYLFRLDARRTRITKRQNAFVTRREIRNLQTDRTSTLQCM